MNTPDPLTPEQRLKWYQDEARSCSDPIEAGKYLLAAQKLKEEIKEPDTRP